MKVVVLGDVGSARYHLGDEAMTEAALDQLAARGVTEVTVIAADPQLARASFGRESIRRIGFSPFDPVENHERLDLVRQIAEGRVPSRRDLAIARMVRVVREADAVLIAGGGNISSAFGHHLYERAALCAIAEILDVPVATTSQTIGPVVRPDDRAAFETILRVSRLLGLREQASADLVLDLGAEADRLSVGLDDAAWLEPRQPDRAAVDALDLPDRFVIGSLTYHRGGTGFQTHEYRGVAASTFDAISRRLDADVVLVPHLGAIGGDPVRDVHGHDDVAATSRSGRVRSLPMSTARQVIEITRRAAACVSTRYHPTVFGPSNLVPTLAIVTSDYSSIRMNGSLGHFGLQDCSISSEIWTPDRVTDALQDVLDADVAGHVAPLISERRAHTEQWWDAVVAVLGGTTAPAPGPMSTAPRLHVVGRSGWRDLDDTVRPIAAQLDRRTTIDTIERKVALADATRRIRQLEDDLDTAVTKGADLRTRLRAAEDRLVPTRATVERRWRRFCRRVAARPSVRTARLMVRAVSPRR